MKYFPAKIAFVLVGAMLITEPIFAQLAERPREPLQSDVRPTLQQGMLQPRLPINGIVTPPPGPQPLQPIRPQDEQIRSSTDIRQSNDQERTTPPETISTPVTNAPAITPTALAVREAITAPLTDTHAIQTIAAKLTPEQRTHTDTIRTEMHALNQLQEQIKNGGTAADMLGRAEEMQNKIQTLKSELQKLRHDRRQSGAALSTGTTEKTTDTLDTELTTLEQSITVRDALITELIKQLKTGTSDADSSELSASITAVSEHPVAASGIAIFVFALLWIFRSRIAEFSGFGIKVSFKSDEKKEEEDDRRE